MPKFKLVTFDVTNTLLHFRQPVGHQYAQAASLNGVTVEAEKLQNTFRKCYKKQVAKYPNFGQNHEMTSNHWWNEIVKKTFYKAGYSDISDTTMTLIADHLYKEYADPNSWTITPGTDYILKKLKENGVILGVISNFDERLEQIITGINLGHYLNFIVTSVKAGNSKPSREIFDYALKLANTSAHEAAHIGDHVEKDYLAARNAGWTSYLLLCSNGNHSEELKKVDKNFILGNILEVEKNICFS